MPCKAKCGMRCTTAGRWNAPRLHPLKPLSMCGTQVWKNCTLYNGASGPVRMQGDQLSDLWERSWVESNIEVGVEVWGVGGHANQVFDGKVCSWIEKNIGPKNREST